MIVLLRDFVRLTGLTSWLLVVSIVVVQTGLLGLAEATGNAECQEQCPGDSRDGTCPLDCTFCACRPVASLAVLGGATPVSVLTEKPADVPVPGERLAAGVSTRIYRPPRLLPA